MFRVELKELSAFYKICKFSYIFCSGCIFTYNEQYVARSNDYYVKLYDLRHIIRFVFYRSHHEYNGWFKMKSVFR